VGHRVILSVIRTNGHAKETTRSGQFDEIAAMLEAKFPVVADMLGGARTDLLAYTSFPVSHWKKIWSTNPLERLNKEIKRRTNVVGIFPNDDAVVRLATAVIVEQHDEWAVTDRHYLAEGSMAKLYQPAQPPALPDEITPAKIAS
jgi:transposase-like protein